MRFSVLASGSGGNACYVEANGARILIDAGLSGRRVLERLKRLGVDPSRLDALVITHEHIDHIRGAGPLARRLGLRVYLNRSTHDGGLRALGKLPAPITVETGRTLSIGGLQVETFTKCHDAGDPMGMVVSCDGLRLGLVTDLGRSTRLVEDRLKGCQALIVEFNHDEALLDRGPYPLYLKRRILGPDGHLSNRQAGELVRLLAHERLGVVVPAHLSGENNLPEIALREAAATLEASGLGGTRVEMSSQDEPTPLLELRNPWSGRP
jgi:phosphoribosyl 1,2-cyclic phosphodiesterase